MRRIIKNLHFFKTFLFLVLLWTSLAMAFFSQRGFSFLERRALAKAPRVNEWRELLYSFPRDLDSFLQDHFGFRSFLVGLHFRLTNGPLAAMIRHDALVGKDGWLLDRKSTRLNSSH